VRAEIWPAYAEQIGWLAEQRAEPFEQSARLVMERYMQCKGKRDGALVDERHRPDWLAGYLPGIVADLRRERMTRTEEPTKPEPRPMSQDAYAATARSAFEQFGGKS
jgi:hypothetical protein